MAIFDNPLDPNNHASGARCACGRHESQSEHERDSEPQLRQTIDSEEQRYENVVVSAVMRAVFPQAATRRAFLQSVGAATALPRS